MSADASSQSTTDNTVLITITRRRPSGDVVKVVPLWRVFLLCVLLSTGAVIVDGISRTFSDHWNQQELHKAKARMERLAEEGHIPAALWLVTNYFEENRGRLPGLADRGIADAQYLHGLLLIREGSMEEGERYMEMASAQGHWPAMRELARRREAEN